MITECGIKTVTEVADNKITISSEYLDGENDKPIIFRADLLDGVKTINNVFGQEGELLFTHIDSGENVAKINNNGELIIDTMNDDNDKYSLDSNGNLIYEE